MIVNPERVRSQYLTDGINDWFVREVKPELRLWITSARYYYRYVKASVQAISPITNQQYISIECFRIPFHKIT